LVKRSKKSRRARNAGSLVFIRNTAYRAFFTFLKVVVCIFVIVAAKGTDTFGSEITGKHAFWAELAFSSSVICKGSNIAKLG